MFEVIKYEGDNSNLVYKYPVEDFNTKSRLVVQQAQEAIFYYKGQMADRFEVPDTYVLDSQNIPILRHLLNFPFGKESPFHAIVYFINKTEQRNIKWGIRQFDIFPKKYNVHLCLGVHGVFSFVISDAELLINTLVGTERELNTETLKEKIIDTLKAEVTEILTDYLNNTESNYYIVKSKLSTLSNIMGREFKYCFATKYGIEITEFIISGFNEKFDEIDCPGNRERFAMYENLVSKDFNIASKNFNNEMLVLEEQGKLEVIKLNQDVEKRNALIQIEIEKIRNMELDITEKEKLAYSVALALAENEGAGNMTSTGFGLGTMIGTANVASTTIEPIFRDVLSSITNDDYGNSKFGLGLDDYEDEDDSPSNIDLNDMNVEKNKVVCPQCHSTISKSKFCPDCGYKFENKCPNCGTETNGAKFCPECGVKL